MKHTKLIGILATVLIVLGTAFCAAGISIHVVYLYDKYQSFAEFDYFDSFLHYYYAVGKGNMVSSILLSMIPVGIGVFLLRKGNSL